MSRRPAPHALGGFVRAALAAAALAAAGLAPVLAVAADLDRHGGASRVVPDFDDGEILVLECANIRRLVDGALLDHKIRFEFTRTGRSYDRFDNNGRGWHPSGRFELVGINKAHVTLVATPRHHSYMERYTGDYYWLDAEDPGRSIWGKCNRSGRLEPLF